MRTTWLTVRTVLTLMLVELWPALLPTLRCLRSRSWRDRRTGLMGLGFFLVGSLAMLAAGLVYGVVRAANAVRCWLWGYAGTGRLAVLRHAPRGMLDHWDRWQVDLLDRHPEDARRLEAQVLRHAMAGHPVVAVGERSRKRL